MNDSWSKWESQVIDGIFPLRRLLGATSHSAVFLTESSNQGHANAAIKLVPPDPVMSAAQLAQWRAAGLLSHPHLVRLFDAGRCRLGDQQFLYVVMEYADERLDRILPQRPLTPDEVRETLAPALDALTFLHGKGLVHGQLKPSNILVVDDQLKLASDCIRPAGSSRASIARVSPYDPPEAKSGRMSAAGDLWAIGITMVESLTGRLPEWAQDRPETLLLPAGFPLEFEYIVRRCLSRDPGKRPTVAELATAIRPSVQTAQVPQPHPSARTAPVAPVVPAAPPAPASSAAPPAPASSAAPPAPALAASPAVLAPASVPPPPPAAEIAAATRGPAPDMPRSALPDRRLPVRAIGAVLAILIAAWAGVRVFHAHPAASQVTPPAPPAPSAAPLEQGAATGSPLPASSMTAPEIPLAPPGTHAPAPAPVASHAAPRPAVQSPTAAAQSPTSAVHSAPSPDASGPVLHREIPDVPRSAQRSIHGHIKIAVRLSVDRTGRVVDETMEQAGSSRYFARLASEAAKKWKFIPADQDARSYLLRFEFSRNTVEARAAQEP